MHIKDEMKMKFNQNKTLLAQANEKFGGVYVAQISEDDGVNLEVEVSEGTIAFTIRVSDDDIKDGATPEDVYVELTDFLESNGVSVFSNAGEWEDAKYSAEE